MCDFCWPLWVKGRKGQGTGESRPGRGAGGSLLWSQQCRAPARPAVTSASSCAQTLALVTTGCAVCTTAGLQWSLTSGFRWTEIGLRISTNISLASRFRFLVFVVVVLYECKSRDSSHRERPKYPEELITGTHNPHPNYRPKRPSVLAGLIIPLVDFKQHGVYHTRACELQKYLEIETHF